LFSPDRKVVQLHLGGGTPTFLLPEDLHRLLSHLFSSFSVSPDGEISIELDPREVTEEHLSILREFSFNRYSIGVQDFDEKVQKAVHRIQPLDLTASLYEKIRSDPRTVSINLDLIYGLPYQTVTTFSKTLKEVLKLRPSRIALFNFAYLPSLKTHQRRIEVRALPPPQEKLRILALAVETLSDAGYRYIGMDHFALPEDELLKAQEEGTLYRNFQGYSTKKGCDLIGIGVTSIGEVMGNYLQNEKDEVSYREKVEKGILPTFRGFLPSLEDRLRKEIIMELMCHFRLDFSSFEERYLLSFSETFSRELELLRPMEEDGLLTIDPEGIEVTPFGRFLIRNIAMVFDTYSSLEKEPRFSRTI
jgi:oxygen-independent coproporphyrinogen-3 oxidase